MRHVRLMLIMPVVLAGCGASTSWILSPAGCTNKASVDAVLHVDPNDARWIWAIDAATGEVISLRLPGGYGVTSDGAPAIVTPSGDSIGRTGDRVRSGCTDIVQRALMIDETDIRPAAEVTP